MSMMPAVESQTSVNRPVGKMPPVIRGAIFAAIGFLVVNTLVSLLHPNPVHTYVTQVSVTFGWFAAMVGWILGVGTWDGVIRPTFGLPATWTERATGWRRYWEYSTNHKVIGLQYIFFSAFGFLLAGLAAMLMRVQLMLDHMWFFTYPQQYLTTVGIHGTIMMFSFGTVIMVGGFGNYFIPMMIGSNKSAFPRLSGISVWFLPYGYLTVVLSPLLGYWTTGWRGYQPLASQDANGIVFYYLGVFAMLLSTLIVALNLTATIIFNRAPGLRWSRLPMYAWAMLAVSILNIIWVPEIIMTFILGLLAHIVPLPFFTAVGSPLTYLQLFWLFGHPEVYIVVLPALAIWQEILPVMGKKSLFARQWGIMGLIFVMILSGMVWAHHMFPTMRNQEILPFSFFTEMISIPTGFAYMVSIGTLWKSRMTLTTPSLLVLMSMFNFLIGGLTGLFLADPAVNMQIHDTFFVVGHFHYTIIGGMVFSFFAGLYYWLPKFSGRMYKDKWGMFGAIWIFLAFNATFAQFFLIGLRGMNRWVPIYPQYLQGMNFEISIFAFFLGAGFLYNLIYVAWVWVKGPKVEENPWRGKTLEWATSSPPGETSFEEIPTVVAGFYDYSDDAPNPVVFKGQTV
ncbi:cbb3-type cytochrome c oxidase subunit I [Alicyclobacillus tolerans]|uniref:cytochrome c oxidase subunit I n=1 Tax=Alicyclobacillus tolerans TaxID=90970 RepID=UPI001F01F8DC|nr:cbb3-type cytochrome c oxidase subunit I [Alicyclobacillus tolerans]MCF8565338.1 cbb3-type cytochrome c oxidase subunit I [Alicyclobacillus tolerans]